MPDSTSRLRPLAIIAVLAIIGAAVYVMMQPNTKKTSIEEHVQDGVELEHYSNTASGITFSYPVSYVLTEYERGNPAEREHHAIVLTRKADAANIPENGEGPPSITIDIFGNGIDNVSVDTWIRNTSASNFKLSPDTVLSTTTLAGQAALSYIWDGLYRGKSVVRAHDSHIFMLSVTSIDTSDPINDDFVALLSSVSLI